MTTKSAYRIVFLDIFIVLRHNVIVLGGIRMFDRKALGKVLEWLLLGLMLLAVVLIVTLPWSIPDVTMHFPGEPERLYEKYFTVLAVSGVMAELLLWQARRVMRNINTGKAFSKDTVKRLYVAGWEALVLAAFYFVMTFFVHKFFMVAVFVAFTIVGLLLFVLGQLFSEAFAYKTENDMTI